MVASLLCVRLLHVEGKEKYPVALSPDDTAQLFAHVRQDVERSARSLRVERWYEVEKRRPLSMKAAHLSHVPLRLWFMRFARTYVPQGGTRHAQDAIAFAKWCAQQPEGTLSEANSEAKALPHPLHGCPL